MCERGSASVDFTNPLLQVFEILQVRPSEDGGEVEQVPAVAEGIQHGRRPSGERDLLDAMIRANNVIKQQ